MTNIVVLIKQVPDTWSERKLKDGDWTLDREAADAVLDEINERAVEEALQIREREGGEGSVTVLTAGPERATEAIRKAMTNEPSIDWLLENQDKITHKYYQMGLDGKI